jgi:CubicO group peptidase (beta-lactamase class C family)
MQLWEEGRFDPQAPIATYLPWFAVKSSFGPITGHHLLTHTAASPTTEPRLKQTTEQDALMFPSSAGLSDFWRNQD